MTDRDLTPEVTDADRELLTRMMTGRPHTEHDWPVVWEQDALQAIARARAEGAAEALAALRETLKGTLDWRDEHTNYGKAVRHTMQYVDAAIRARGEGGKA